MVTKAVIAAAGFGTRFLPATKNVPKELIPIINKPVIHYKVDACIKAGIRDIIIVTRFGNHSIEDYFDQAPVLENYLREKGKISEADEIKNIYTNANFIFIRQDPTLPYGNACPLYSAKSVIEGEDVIYCYGDDFVLTDSNYLGDPIKYFNDTNSQVVMPCVKTTPEQISKIGACPKFFEGEKDLIEYFIEKPSLNEITSEYLSIGNYVMSANVIDSLDPKRLDSKGEFLTQLTFIPFMKQKKVRMFETQGLFLTNGDPLNYLKATVEVALQRDDVKADFLQYLQEKLKQI